MNSERPLSSSVMEYLRSEPFPERACDKDEDFLLLLNLLSTHHLDRCSEYSQIVRMLFPDVTRAESLEEVPFIPVRLFKLMRLASIPIAETVKTMTSSGTTGQAVSQIFLDKNTAMAQSKALSQITASVLGKSRMPMLIADSLAVNKNREMFSARGAGIRGFSVFGRDIEYMLDDQMKLRTDAVLSFLEKHDESPVFVFGFTYMIWEHICAELERLGQTLPIHRGILLHGGGWKKLASLNIGTAEFSARVKNLLGIARVVNYYGMVEQTGSIFIECEMNYLHSSSYSEVIVRNPITLQPNTPGEEGILQLLSVLPMSYPGHSILTEDLGTVVGDDGCMCGRPGRHFVVSGRIKDAEIRGCSDTFNS